MEVLMAIALIYVGINMAVLLAIAFIYVGINTVVSGVDLIIRILSKED